MPRDEIELSIVGPASDAAQWALSQYFAELHRRFPGGFDPGDGADDAVQQFTPPQGLFIVARREGETLGCGALQFLDDERAEVKRMWISPRSRGLGLGKRLLARLEDEIGRAGRSTALLDTNATLTEAIAMYRTSGYVEIEPYNANPYADLWFAKTLDATPPPLW